MLRSKFSVQYLALIVEARPNPKAWPSDVEPPCTPGDYRDSKRRSGLRGAGPQTKYMVLPD